MCRTDPFRKAGETMPTERNNRQLSDSKCEEVRAKYGKTRYLRGGAWFVEMPSESFDAALRDLVRETRRETLLEAAEICNMVCEKIAAAKNRAGNTEEGRALQRCVWTAFACEQQILLLIDNDAKKAAELERKAKEI